MSIVTDLLKSIPTVQRMITESEMEVLKLQSRLNLTTVSQFRTNKSIGETALDKAEWIEGKAKAEADALAASTPLKKKKAELERDAFDVQLRELEIAEEEDASDPEIIIKSQASKKRMQALLDIENELLTSLKATLKKLEDAA